MAWVTAFERCPLPQLFEQHREAIDVLRQEGKGLGIEPMDNQWTTKKTFGGGRMFMRKNVFTLFFFFFETMKNIKPRWLS